MFGFNPFPETLRPFDRTFRCYSVSMLPGNERHDVEKGGKIIMPPSALDHLTRLNIVYPMLFKLTNVQTNRITHSGVLEFLADEGKVYLPYWMMRNLLLSEGSIVRVESTSLPVATYTKFQPQSVDFLDITNPKAVLENALRNFACLTTEDVIAIDYNNRVYELCVLETRPGRAVTIIECDMNVEFEAPVGYKEPQRVKKEEHLDENHTTQSEEEHEEDNSFKVFAGEGNRLDGKKKQIHAPPKEPKKIRRGIPDYDYKLGTLKFIRSAKPVDTTKNEETKENQFQPFSGKGKALIKPR